MENLGKKINQNGDQIKVEEASLSNLDFLKIISQMQFAQFLKNFNKVPSDNPTAAALKREQITLITPLNKENSHSFSANTVFTSNNNYQKSSRRDNSLTSDTSTAVPFKKEEITQITPSNKDNSQIFVSNNISNYEKPSKPDNLSMISLMDRESVKSEVPPDETPTRGFVFCKKKMISEPKSELSLLSINIKKNEKSNSILKRSKRSATTTYPSKNILKILGNTIITKILRKDFRDKTVIQKSLTQQKKNLKYPTNWEEHISLFIFQDWIKEKNFMVNYGNIYVFKEIWSFQSDPNLDWKEIHFRWALRNITLYFLENESYENLIFEKNIKKGSEYIVEYLKKIPRLLMAIDMPENFNSLGGGIKKFRTEQK
jgi:hypothetical protein